MMKKATGFTLIELMIVIAIIGILSVIASSAYLGFAVRAQVAEALSLMSPMTTSVAEYYNHIGTYPPDNDSVGLASPTSVVGNYVVAVDISGSPYNIEATFGRRAAAQITSQILQLSVITDSSGIVRWHCRSPTIEAKYLPTNCRS